MADVTVMGGGIFGLSIAWACARRGAQVHLIERHHIGAGSSGGLVGALAPHTPENWNPKKAFQLDSLLMAETFWADVAQLSGVDPGYARLGRLQPLPDERAVAQAQRRSEEAKDLWHGKAIWRIESGEDSWRGTSPTGLWVFDTLSARLHPRRAVQALAGAIRALGGRITEGNQPLNGADGLPPADLFTCGAVIWATGYPGLVALSADLGHPCGGGVKGQAALLACDAAHQPQLFTEGLHIVPHLDATVAIGSTSERAWDRPDSTDDQLDALIARARAACPMLRAAPV
ncbi:MAG: FAD-dependent oxidoreductase, partial [Rhodobacteraceae bacterium]|nr:FAD-dependent oxidoreductase [Paracoccaceae bacterium]